jgi:soluble lytic murein transglycosylase-like protein
MKGFTDRYDQLIEDATAVFLPFGYDWKMLKAQYIAESGLDCTAASGVGAKGIAQFMPGTWTDVRKSMKLPIGNICDPEDGIKTGAFYMNYLLGQWKSDRTTHDRRCLALASYNAGLGNLLKAQKLSGGKADYPSIIACLPKVTGKDNAKQTSDYVVRIMDFHEKLCNA